MESEHLAVLTTIGLFLASGWATGAGAVSVPATPDFDGQAPSHILREAPFVPNRLDLLEDSWVVAMEEGGALAFHQAQMVLTRSPASAVAIDASTVLPAAGTGGAQEDTWVLLQKVWVRLDAPIKPQESREIEQQISGLETDQKRVVGRVLAAYLDALDAPDPLAARGRFTVLADELQRTSLAPGPLLVDVCGYVILDLSHADDHHGSECDYRLQLDAGGDDVYGNNAGGTVPGKAGMPLPALAVDLGGADRFMGRLEHGGVNGGGHGAAAALVSVSGDDVYDGSGISGAVNGGGFRGGAGLLVDHKGNDTYHGSLAHGGVNGGAGFAGAGLLVDQGGEDDYGGEVRTFGGVNGGSNDGVGGLVDIGAGADVYDGRVGVRGGVNAGNEQGVSFLFDDGGDDRFDGKVSGGGVNGGVTGKGVARFVSGGGNNSFSGTATRNGGINGGAYQGDAAFFSLGSGRDVYEATVWRTGAVNGAGLLGRGALVDEGGDDRFDGWIRGSGAVNGAGVWGDGRLESLGTGNDGYRAVVLEHDHEELTGQMAAGSNGNGETGSGALVDQGGRDWYEQNGGPRVWDETVFPKGSLGMQLDRDPEGLP